MKSPPQNVLCNIKGAHPNIIDKYIRIALLFRSPRLVHSKGVKEAAPTRSNLIQCSQDHPRQNHMLTLLAKNETGWHIVANALPQVRGTKITLLGYQARL